MTVSFPPKNYWILSGRPRRDPVCVGYENSRPFGRSHSQKSLGGCGSARTK
jgi:hypothetical protein